MLILRKGGIHEERGAFRPEHPAFWLFPTKFHEAPASVIASKRPALEALAARADDDMVDLQFFAAVDAVHEIHDRKTLKRLQGQHIWSEQVLAQRFEFGRSQSLFALLVRVYRTPTPARLPRRDSYGGCKSWIELEHPLSLEELVPVLDQATFTARCAAITHGIAEPDHALVNA